MMPKVIFNIKFTPPKAGRDWSQEQKAEWARNRAFYTCHAEYNYFSYTLNDKKLNNAVDEDTPKAYDEAEQGSRRGSYMEKSSGVFNEKGVLSNEQKKQLEETLKSTQSNIWHGFVSFDPETTPIMNSQKACIDFVRANMGAYLKQTHLKPENVELFCSLHSDTDNAHIHFCFFEKQPLRINSRGEAVYTEKGAFGVRTGTEWRIYADKNDKNGTVLDNAIIEEARQKFYAGKDEYSDARFDAADFARSLGAKKVDVFRDVARDNFLLNAELYLDENRFALEQARDQGMELLKAASPAIAEKKEFRELRSKLASLGKKLPEKGRYQYGSSDMAPFRADIDRVAKVLIDAVPGMRKAYDQMQHEIFRRDTLMRKTCAEQDISYELYGRPRTEGVRADFAKRLGNAVLQMAKPKRLDKFRDRTHMTNDLARKISAKINRSHIAKKIGSFARNIDAFLENSIDFSRLHIAEREIARDNINKEAPAHVRVAS